MAHWHEMENQLRDEGGVLEPSHQPPLQQSPEAGGIATFGLSYCSSPCVVTRPWSTANGLWNLGLSCCHSACLGVGFSAGKMLEGVCVCVCVLIPVFASGGLSYFIALTGKKKKKGFISVSFASFFVSCCPV